MVDQTPDSITHPKGRGKPYDTIRLQYYTDKELDNLIINMTDAYNIHIADEKQHHARSSISAVIRCLHIKQNRGLNVRAQMLTALTQAHALHDQAEVLAANP